MPSLLILVLLLPFQAAPSGRCSLSGTVVAFGTGEPLSKVDLRLEPIDDQVTQVAVTKSDAEGRFALVDLDPGSYRLIGRRNGYLETSYGARSSGGDGAILRLEPRQNLNHLQFKLAPSAVIAGTVRDSDGELLEDAHVILSRLTYEYGGHRVEGENSTDTDDRGEYRFGGLAAGKYYVGVEMNDREWGQVDHSAQAGPKEKSVPTLYPGVTEMALAAPIEVATGGRATGIDVTLVRSRVFRVSGRVTNAPATGHLRLVLKDPINAGWRDFVLQTITRNAAGDFEFRGIPPGSYQLNAGEAGRNSIVVLASDVENVRVGLTPGAEVNLRIAAEGPDKPNLSEIGYFLTTDGRHGFMSSPPWETDRFTARNVPPDHYILKLSGKLLRQLYVKTARAGDTDVLADGLTVAGPGTIAIDVVLASDGGRVQGVVRDKNGQSVTGATILLAPDRRSREDLFKSVTSDQNGHYEFAAIAPGNYKLFAWDDVEPKAWSDPDFLKDYEKLGEKLVLEAEARAAVDLSLATRADAQ
jgi:hypothetical protein